MGKSTGLNRYQLLIERIFESRWSKGLKEFYFERADLESTALELGITLPKNLGDVMYALRYRISFPESILATQPKDREWVIEGAGRARYRLRLVKKTRILPRPDLAWIAIPDATPELIRAYALDDEQALLAIVRYNRLIDTFLGLTTYSLQNHLRTTVSGIGQIEIDELYIGLDKYGCHYVIPVQAKGGSDQIGVVQTTQDIRFVEQRFPGMRCRAISAQFMEEGIVALFELILQDDEVRVVEERHYKLVPYSELDPRAVRGYS
ncbi:endonuclease [Diaphorobacter sp. HDW4B]|uniref:endonuclease n=1 Tax=Diaphorobacter sp. HDW4B TaxID=2714925 RepID=UPI0014092AD3|nr:endonuclease [Diaphorobacter sp. HDW4B]QIL70699.1 endonuclease [Diaphorobacter sp. HDW4B]